MLLHCSLNKRTEASMLTFMLHIAIILVAAVALLKV